VNDVVIVGGGPVGLYLAGSLAESGVKVVVLERKKEIGKEVICTGIIGREAFEKFQLPSQAIDSSIQKVELVSPGGDRIFYTHPHPFAYVVDRVAFDQLLAARAQARGVEIISGIEVVDIRRSAHIIEVTGRENDHLNRFYKAKICVLATGNSFRFHHQLGLGLPQEFVFGGQVELHDDEKHLHRLWFGKAHAPGGFAWQIPLKRKKLKVGLLSSTDTRPYLVRILKKYYPLGKQLPLVHEISQKAITQGIVSPSFSDRVLAVGEAAGQVKTTTGGGIFYGLLGARIAEKIIKQALITNSFQESHFSIYEYEWRRRLEKEIRLGLTMRKFYSLLDDEDVSRLFEIARDNGVFPLVQQKGNFDWHSQLILNLIRHLSHHPRHLPPIFQISWEVWKKAKKEFQKKPDVTEIPFTKVD
jgi:geranylgeranyl reductase family protein